jgi:hypothetical protein
VAGTGRRADRPDSDREDTGGVPLDEGPGGTARPDGEREQPSPGDRTRGAGPDTAEPAPVATGQNYQITDHEALIGGGKKTRFKNNVAAIELVRRLEEEGRNATPAAQDVLTRFVGWGGLKEAFRGKNGQFAKGWEREGEALEALLTSDELRAAATSTINAH